MWKEETRWARGEPEPGTSRIFNDRLNASKPEREAALKAQKKRLREFKKEEKEESRRFRSRMRDPLDKIWLALSILLVLVLYLLFR